MRTRRKSDTIYKVYLVYKNGTEEFVKEFKYPGAASKYIGVTPLPEDASSFIIKEIPIMVL